MSKKVVTLGEIMMRLSTPDFLRFVQSDRFDVTYGGGEANVAAALCNYGLNGTFVTKVPGKCARAVCNQSFASLWSRYTIYSKGRKKTWNIFPGNRRFDAGIAGDL